MFKTGLTIQKLDNIQPSSFVKIANVMKLEHIEFDMTVFDDIENVLKIIKTKQTAIHAPYFAAGLKPGDEVIVSAYTWHLHVSQILALHAIPVFWDIDPKSACI